MNIILIGGTCAFQKRRLKKKWENRQKIENRSIIRVDSESLGGTPFQRDFFADERAFVIVASEKNKNFIKNLQAQIGANKSDYFLVVFQGKITHKEWPDVEIINGEELDFSAKMQLMKDLLKEHNLNYGPGLERFILERFDGDFFLIDNALWILEQNFRDEKIIEKHVSELLPDFLGSHVFKIFSLLKKNDWPGAEIFVVQLLERGESELAILGMLTKFLKDSVEAAHLPVHKIKFQRALNLCATLDLSFKGLGYGAEFSLRQVFDLIA